MIDTSGQPVAALDVPARILVPAGHEGPAFVVYPNFDTIMRWNRSEYYAIAVGRLADRIAGAGKLHRPIPPSDVRLTLDVALQLQENLVLLGHDPGEPDGLVGPATRAALARFQAANGLLPDGHVDQAAIDAVSEMACRQRSDCP